MVKKRRSFYLRIHNSDDCRIVDVRFRGSEFDDKITDHLVRVLKATDESQLRRIFD